MGVGGQRPGDKEKSVRGIRVSSVSSALGRVMKVDKAREVGVGIRVCVCMESERRLKKDTGLGSY